MLPRGLEVLACLLSLLPLTTTTLGRQALTHRTATHFMATLRCRPTLRLHLPQLALPPPQLPVLPQPPVLLQLPT